MESCSGKRTAVLSIASITLFENTDLQDNKNKILRAASYLDAACHFFLASSQEIPDFPAWEGMSVFFHLYLVS